MSPGLTQRQVDRHVGLCARVRLHVGVVGAEERLGARDGQRLGDVHELAAAVVALAGIALGVLVREHRAGGLENRAAHEVLRRDQLEALVLPLLLVANRLRDSGSVSASERCMKESVAESDIGAKTAHDPSGTEMTPACRVS